MLNMEARYSIINNHSIEMHDIVKVLLGIPIKGLQDEFTIIKDLIGETEALKYYQTGKQEVLTKVVMQIVKSMPKNLYSGFKNSVNALIQLQCIQNIGIPIDTGALLTECALAKREYDETYAKLHLHCNEVGVELSEKYLMTDNTFPVQYIMLNQELEAVRKKWKHCAMLDFHKLSEYISKDEHGIDRIHCMWDGYATVTGRIQSYNPNVQGLPKRIRQKCFKAPHGRQLIYADYKNEEIVILAALSGDISLLQEIQSGRDLHLKVASVLLKKETSVVSDKERAMAKRLTFATLYGAGTKTLEKISYEFLNYSLKGLIIQNTIRELYPAIEILKQRIVRAGVIEMIDGSVIPLERIQKNYSYVNRLVQGTGAIILKQVINQLGEKLPNDSHIVCLIHDEVIVETSNANLQKCKLIITQIMQDALKTYGIAVSMPVEIKEELKDEQERFTQRDTVKY